MSHLINRPYAIDIAKLKPLAHRSKGKITKLYLHWTAGRYEQVFDDYHISIGKTGTIYLSCSDFTELKAHTWHRNTGSIGIALCCAYLASCRRNFGNATPLIDFGPYGPTQEQIESMAKVIAVITKELGLDISEETVLTHQEAASQDGYGPGDGDPDMRWDLWYLPDLPCTIKLVHGGHVLRGKALWYRSTMNNN